MEEKTSLRKNLLTLDYLEFFCQSRVMIIGCKQGGEEVWISPFGPHCDDLSRDQLDSFVDSSSEFEIIQVMRDLDVKYSLSRSELESRLQMMVN